MIKFGLILGVSLVVIQAAVAQDKAPFKDRPGSIPVKPERPAAADLYYKGRELQPDEARELADKKLLKNEKGETISLDQLDPDPTSVVWKPYPTKNHWRPEAANQKINDLQLLGLQESGEELTFESEFGSPVERYYFTATKQTANGPKTYQLLLDYKGHNMLLRKALLRKLGYVVPAMDRLAKVRIKFKTALDKKNMALDLATKTFRPLTPWILPEGMKTVEERQALYDNEDTFLDLQDVIVMEGPNDSFFNFARGDMPDGVPMGRRLFNALLVPFNMTDAPESLNWFKWVNSFINNNQLVMPYEDAGSFNAISYEDARWITRRILKLDRAQWKEIFDQVRIPEEIEALWMEKTIAHRDYLIKFLHFENEFSPLKANDQISMGARLEKGTLKGGRTWSGYARNWAGVMPTSPATKAEMMGLVEAQAGSSVGKSMISKIGTYLPATDVGYKKIDHALDVAVENFLTNIKNKTNEPIPKKWFSFKYFDTDAGLSRDIVSGTYMGTDARIQVADTIYFGAEAGWYYSRDALPARVQLDGQVKGWWVTSYSHIKPVGTTKAFYDEPFRNLIVPYYKAKARRPLEEMQLQKQVYRAAQTDEEKLAVQNKINASFKEFGKQFGQGEALIVSKSWGPEWNISLAKPVSPNATISAFMRDRFTVMDRLQVYRKDENTVQVYVDPALFNIFSVGLGASVHGVPVFRFAWEAKNGVVSTNLFEFNINPKLSENPDFFDNILAVTAALQGADLEYFQLVQKKHWKIDHDFSEKGIDLKFLFFNRKTSNATDEVRITDKESRKFDYVHRYQGYRSGIDYQTLFMDVATALARRKNPNITIQAAGSGNPADTYKGSSSGRIVTLDLQKVPPTAKNPSGVRWETIMGSVRYSWKGWDASRKEANKTLQEANKKFGFEVFHQHTLAQAKTVQFYTVDVQMFLYYEAFYNIAQLTNKQVQELFDKYYRVKDYFNDAPSPNGWVVSIQNDLGGLRKAITKGDSKAVALHLTDILDVAESQLEFPALVQMIGGPQNMFIRPNMGGFRVGVEDAEEPILPMTGGEIGSSKPQGGLNDQLQQMGISPGEGMISWLLNTLM